MSRSFQIIFNAWLTYVAGMVCFGWALSAFGAYRMMAPASVILLGVIGILSCKSWRSTSPADRGRLASALLFPPFLILLAAIILAGSLYLTTVLDSLSYRIPRVLMWLQEGKVHFIDNPDARLNFMTPVWEFASTPVYQVAGFRLLWLGSAISWVLLYLSLYTISLRITTSAATEKWLAIIPSAAVGFVLQAPSTMNDIWAAALVAISLVFILEFEEKSSFGDIISSGLALALAAGAKPHFAVLVLPWLLWFFFSPSRPLASIRWKWVLPLGVLAVMCSPLPTFVTNHFHYGSFKGPAADGGFGLGPWWINLIFGTVMMAWQVFQLPVNPLAGTINAYFQDLTTSTGLSGIAPRFKLVSLELPIVDGASIGLVAACALLFGLIIAWRNRATLPTWAKYSFLAGFSGFLVAVSQVVPGTLGRSFLPFFIPIFPMALYGLTHLKFLHLKLFALFVGAAALLAIAVSPSHPLWPAKTLADRGSSFHDQFSRYLRQQEKPFAGISVVNAIPQDVTEVGIMAVGDQSLIQLWNCRHADFRVRFLPRNTRKEDLIESGIEWFILIAADPTLPDSLFGELAASLDEDRKFKSVFSDEFSAKSIRGYERWTLYRMNPEQKDNH